MKTIAFLACSVTLPGGPDRRIDAFEHDYQVAALREPLKALGYELEELNWDQTDKDWSAFDGVIIGTTWDYWDRWEEFLTALAKIEASGTQLFNPSSLVRWNSHKSYLKDLAQKGANIVPTLWFDHPSGADLEAAFDTLGSDDIVVKRQVGAGAKDQYRYKRGESIPDYPFEAMVQSFLPTIQTEGEYSFVMIDGELSHCLIKRAQSGDYRIQSMYGGVEEAVTPNAKDLKSATDALGLLDETPLYGRVDMVRDAKGELMLMELELIEPYLYPLQGPELGERFAAALAKRLG